MNIQEITGTSLVREARKNPELNPKISVNEYIKQHLDKAKDIPGTNIKNSFVSFTEVDKLGINPGSGYNTPLGVYSYPSSYVVAKMGSESRMSFLPFAGDNPYANIFSVKGNIIDLYTMGDRELGNYNRKMVDVFIKTAGITPGSGEWKTTVDMLEKNIFIDASALAKISSPGGKFWFITMEFANLLMKAQQTRRQWRSGQHRVSWNKLFREIGIDGCIDSDGDGIIHTSEPAQAVFFSIKSIDKNQRVDNRYSPAELRTNIARGKDNRKKAKIASSMSEDEQVELVRDHYSSIKHIRNPTEKVQLAAVKRDPAALKYIKNPSENVQIATVEQHGRVALQYIRKPTEKVQIAAVERDRAALGYIKKPTEKVQIAAVEKDPIAVLYIQNPSEKVQLAAVERDPAALEYIQNPTEKVQLAAREID